MEEERQGILVVLACHCVFDTRKNLIYAEHPEDRPVYESQLIYAFNHLIWRFQSDPLLVISGGPTKNELRCSESRSYLEFARSIGLNIPINVELEEYALTSIENLLFSLYVYCDINKVYPRQIDVISWEFKRSRFEQTFEAINNWDQLGQKWERMNFFPVGDLWSTPKESAKKDEGIDIASLKKGIDEYYKTDRVKRLIEKRDVFNSRPLARKRYEGRPLPF